MYCLVNKGQTSVKSNNIKKNKKLQIQNSRGYTCKQILQSQNHDQIE
jgi:hypothetical protein